PHPPPFPTRRSSDLSRSCAAPHAPSSRATRSATPRGALARNSSDCTLATDSPSGQVDPRRLQLRVLLKRVQRLVASDARLLEAAERHGQVIGIVAIDIHGAGTQ